MPDTPDSCGANLLANILLPSLIGDKVFDFPEVDLDDDKFKIPDENDNPLFDNIVPLTNDDLTTRVIGGSGTFDAIMDSLGAHLKGEHAANRITGQEYTKAYIGLVGAALGGAVQYLLGRDQAYWNAVMAQQQARMVEVQVVKARVELEAAKMMLIMTRYQALQAEVEYGLTKMKISTEDATFCNVKAQTRQVEYNTDEILPTQRAGLVLDNATKTYTNTHLLPRQRDMLQEQVEVQRAQTLDTRTDGATIVGSVGKQKDLYNQQIVSYQRDAEVKAAKLFTDAWITQKTLDEGLLAPNNFTNASMDEILANLKINNVIGTDTPPPVQPDP